MREERPTIEAPGGPMPAYLAAPDGWPPGPAVVVVQEWWGLNEHVQSVARRLADEGYGALAPDLYRGKQTDEPDEARKLAMEVDRELVLDDLKTSVGWLLAQGSEAVGALGFCMGATLVWRLAHEEGRLSAAVPFYPGAAEPGGELRCTLMVHFADPRLDVPRESIEALSRHLAEQRYAHQAFIYEGAPHAFFNDARDSYREEAAKLAWDRTISFLRNELGGISG